jgi:nucleoside-diphosphate-sugar epimerase
MKILVTGGAGYLGSVLSLALIEDGHDVRSLDNVMHGGRALLPLIGHRRFAFIAGDIRDSQAVARAADGVDAVVHLAAIVGDPACARDRELACAVNERASVRLIDIARDAGLQRFVFASTCSNYGRMADTSIAATETHELRPLSLYAETKVAVELKLLALPAAPMAATVLRFATLFGLSPRMRFDLTINQFVMEMLVHRKLTVFGERFWRPYVHVRDAASAIIRVLAAPAAVTAGQVFNVGHTDENYRKLDLVDMISRHVPDAEVTFVPVPDDPRDYRVSFERIRTTLGFVPTRRVANGVAELAAAIESGVVDPIDDPTFSNLRDRPRPAVAVKREPICVQ